MDQHATANRATRVVCDGMKPGALFAIASLVACSAPELPCESCLKTGDACDVSYQCPFSDICNVSDDEDPELSDLTKPGHTCITVTCANDDECTAPRTCTLEHLCRIPVCASDDACKAGEACVRGKCRSAGDTDLARCEVLGRRIVAHSGERIEPRAYAFDRSNRLLPHVDFTWSTSDPEGAFVEPDGAIVRGGFGGDAAHRACRHATLHGPGPRFELRADRQQCGPRDRRLRRRARGR